MAFTELEHAKYKKQARAYVERKRPPAHIRKELDIDFRFQGQSIEIFEIRPRWDNPKETMENPVAKATYVKTQKVWKVFWQRADLKWHGYEPNLRAASLEEFFNIVETDQYGCFWG